MAITYVNGGDIDLTASATTVAVTVTGLTSGNTNVVIVWVKHEGTATNVSASDGSAYTNVLTGSTAAAAITDHGNLDLHAGFFYRTGVTGVTSVTVTATFAAARTFRTIQAWVYSYTATDTVSVDQHGEATGNGTTPTSANITTTGTDYVCVGGYGEYAVVTKSARQINGTAATHSLDGLGSGGNYTSSWDLIFTSTFAAGHANLTINTSSDWICNIIAVKAVAAAATDTQEWLTAGRLAQGYRSLLVSNVSY